MRGIGTKKPAEHYQRKIGEISIKIAFKVWILRAHQRIQEDKNIYVSKKTQDFPVFLLCCQLPSDFKFCHLVPIFVPKHIKKIIMADLPSSLTTLFDLKTKQSIANETIITHSTTVFARKLADYFKILYEDESHIVGGFSKSQSLITIKITEGQGMKNVTMTLETPK